MCRFVASISKESIQLKKILADMPNSLIAQSKTARETKSGLNADGFGIGWYDHRIDRLPAVFKSTQPAWNDENLPNIASKVKSECFIGHVRASTVGGVSVANCHPFTFHQYLFAHNGTIDHFEEIKKDLLILLDDQHFGKIKGQTDSEHFFFLVCDFIEKTYPKSGAQEFVLGFKYGICKVNELLVKHRLVPNHRINAVLTNGEELAAVRYHCGKDHPPLALYYTMKDSSILVASEPLDDVVENWEEIPLNHILTVDKNFEINLHYLLD